MHLRIQINKFVLFDLLKDKITPTFAQHLRFRPLQLKSFKITIHQMYWAFLFFFLTKIGCSFLRHWIRSNVMKWWGYIVCTSISNKRSSTMFSDIFSHFLRKSINIFWLNSVEVNTSYVTEWPLKWFSRMFVSVATLNIKAHTIILYTFSTHESHSCR